MWAHPGIIGHHDGHYETLIPQGGKLLVCDLCRNINPVHELRWDVGFPPETACAVSMTQHLLVESYLLAVLSPFIFRIPEVASVAIHD